jgi:hypothetical protein
MKFYLSVLSVLLLFSCSNPDIYIPVNDNPGQTDVNNLSQVYVFFQTDDTGDTLSDMHKNQIISSTHFVVHIDRRLPLKTIITDLEWLHKKRHKKSIHNVPGMHLFFSHVDSVSNKIRLNVFDSLQIMYPFYYSKEYVKKYPKSYAGLHLLHLDLMPGKLVVSDTVFDFPKHKNRLANYIYKQTADSTPTRIVLNADYNVSYDRYNDLYGFLVNLDSNRVRLMHKQFWYNPGELKAQ